MLFDVLGLCVALAVVVAGLVRKGGYVQAPCAVAVVYLGWVAPQMAALRADLFLPPDGLAALQLMTLLCLIGVIAGWEIAKRGRIGATVQVPAPLPVKAMIFPVAALTAFVALMTLLIALQPEEARQADQWSGPITVFAFFGQLRIVPLALALLMVLHKRTPWTLLLLAANVALTFPIVFVLMRRSEMVDVTFATVGALWLARRIRIPAPVLVVGATVLAVVVFSISELRKASEQIYVQSGERPALFDKRLLGEVNFQSTTGNSIKNAPDLRNAVYVIKYTKDSGDYMLGGVVWNDFVFQWVPGQIVGYEFKKRLMSNRGGLYTQINNQYDYKYDTGTTSTGFGASYQDLAYFGAIFFAIMAGIIRLIYNRAMTGDPWMQALYLTATPLVLTSITHGHGKFFAAFPLFAAAIFSVRALASRSGRVLPFRGRTRSSAPSRRTT
ncbi:MAG: hypothetical protein Q8R82_01285 [Hyphomonadaceae bacterium]|nr:hypothetical protein [Hyphomonadaceae bacterium]